MLAGWRRIRIGGRRARGFVAAAFATVAPATATPAARVAPIGLGLRGVCNRLGIDEGRLLHRTLGLLDARAALGSWAAAAAATGFATPGALLTRCAGSFAGCFRAWAPAAAAFAAVAAVAATTLAALAAFTTAATPTTFAALTAVTIALVGCGGCNRGHRGGHGHRLGGRRRRLTTSEQLLDPAEEPTASDGS